MTGNEELTTLLKDFEARCSAFRQELSTSRQEIETLEARLEDGRERLRRAVMSFGYSVLLTAEIPLRNRLIRRIYWHDRDIPTVWIADAFGLKVYEVVQIAGRSASELACSRCGKHLTVSSRDELKRLLMRQRQREREKDSTRLGPLLCPDCRQVENAEIRRVHEEKRRMHLEALAPLRSLSYEDYLKTSSWIRRRVKHLEEAEFKCQVCGAEDGSRSLEVRHRSRKNLGDEDWEDLIAMCEECDSLFQKRFGQGRYSLTAELVSRETHG